MSEGEFKKRLLYEHRNFIDLYYDREGRFSKEQENIEVHPDPLLDPFLPLENVEKMLEEARKEFPVKFIWQVVIEERTNGNSIFEQQPMPGAKLPKNRANANINKDEVINWFLKWFGEADEK